MHEEMARRLRQAYEDPTRRFCYYSGNGAPTGSERLNRMAHWDWTPQPTLFAGGGASTCMFPLALGCPPRETSEGKEWVRPLIREPRQALEFRAPDVRSGRTGEVLEHLARRVRELEPGQRLRQPDIQSPLGVAELMWGQDLYVALLEHPEAVHHLLGEITDFIIAFVAEVRTVCGDRLNAAGFPGIWADETGTMVADDSMSLVSPEMHLDFSVPYVNRLAEAAGPLFYHSCSWRGPHLPNIDRIGPLRACNWNPGNSADPQTLVPRVSGRCVVALHLTLGMHRDPEVLTWGPSFADEFEFFAYCLDAMQENTTMYWWFSNIVQNGPVMERIYDLLDERGYTPAAAGLAG